MVAVPTATFRTLHRIHRQLTDLRTRLDRGPKQVAFGEANVAKFEAALASAKEEVKKCLLTTSQKELQLKEREGQIEDTRAKLNAASTNKEYTTLVERIAADEQANSVLSDEILEMFDRAEQLGMVVKEKESDLAKGNEECQKLRDKVDGERDSLETDLARLTKECEELESTLPVDLMQDFTRVVGTRGEDGLACVEEEFCGNCNQKINAQMFNLLLQEQLVLCQSCGAYLYLPENREPKHSGG